MALFIVQSIARTEKMGKKGQLLHQLFVMKTDTELYIYGMNGHGQL